MPASDLLPVQPKFRLSVVVPLYNEEANLDALSRRLLEVLASLTEDFEIIYVNDGSSDSTPQGIEAWHQREPRIKGVMLSRNFGHQAAITAGLAFASGDAVVVMDGDLQDRPEEIPRFVALWRQGYEVVYAVRRRRAGVPWWKRLAYATFYRVQQQVADISVPLDSGDFALLDRRVVQWLNQFPEGDRFLRGLRCWVGLRQVGVEVDRDARAAGEPKYSLRSLVRLAADGLVSFSLKPLRWLLALGGGLVLGGGAAFLGGLFTQGADVLSLGGLMGLFCGIQLVALGIVGEYVGRTYMNLKARPVFLVDRLLGLEGRLEQVPRHLAFPAQEHRKAA